MRSRSLFHRSVFAGIGILAAGVWAASALAADAPGAPTEAQLQAWAKQLGDEDFQKRTEAKNALLKAGKAAVPALKAALSSTDPETKNSAAALLDQLKWHTLRADPQYLELFPEGSVFVAHLAHVEQSLARARKTAVGGLLDSPDFKPLVEWAGRQTKAAPNEVNLLLKWLQQIKGQAAGALWEFDPMDPSKMRMAAVLELPAENPEKIFKEFLTETHLGEMLREERQQGLSVWVGNNGVGAVTRAGRHLILAINLASLMQTANGLCQPSDGNLASSASFRKLKAGLSGDVDFTLLVNFEAYKKMLAALPGVGAAVNGLMDKVGYESMEWFAMTTSVAGDRFEDRFILIMNEKPSKITKLMQAASASQKPLAEALAMAPADAVWVGNGYLDGPAMTDFGLEYFKAILEMQAAMGVPAVNLEEEIAKVEQAVGVKLTDLAGCMKGDLVYWATLAKGLAPPDLGLSIGCPDEAKAKELAEKLSQITNGLCKMTTAKDAPAIEKSTKGGSTIFTESEDSPWLAKPERKQIPYRLSWAASGTRVVVALSVPSLQGRLMALAAKDPGFDPAKVLPPGVAPAETKGLMVLDLRALLNYGAKFGLPLLAPQLAKQPEIQKLVLDLAGKDDPFKGLPPLTVTSGLPKNGVIVSAMHSPVPVLPAYAVLIGGIVFASKAAQEAPVMIQAPVKVQEPPGP